MGNKRSSTSTAQFVAKLLAVMPMPVEDVPKFIAKIDRVLRGLTSGVAETIAAPLLESTRLAVATGSARAAANMSRPSPESGKLPGSVPLWGRSLNSTELPAAALPAIEVIPPRRRGRPIGSGRKTVPAMRPVQKNLPQDDIGQQAPLQSRLLRRADVHAESSQQEAVPAVLQSNSDNAIRGVVKWFDGRSGKGALRLTGIGDVALEQRVLDESHVKRLYRDQEVEAHVEHQGSKVRLLSISILSRLDPGAVQPFGNSSDTRTVRRQPRPVVVEIKRDAARRRRPRTDAEQAFGTDVMELPVR